MNALSKQVGGTHYKSMNTQPSSWCTRNAIPFVEGCIIKYAIRHEHKGGALDLEKAIHFCDLRIEDSHDYPKTAGRTWQGLPARVISWYENEGHTFAGSLPLAWEAIDCVAQWLETREREFLHEAKGVLQELKDTRYADS